MAILIIGQKNSLLELINPEKWLILYGLALCRNANFNSYEYDTILKIRIRGNSYE
jgi:hypothetical protein